MRTLQGLRLRERIEVTRPRSRGVKVDVVLRVLIERLVSKGIDITAIPAYVRDLANSVVHTGDSSISELGSRMRLLGWDTFDLDDQTLQLILAILETDGLGIPKPVELQVLECTVLGDITIGL